jgi:hypothetical protein
VPATPLSVDLSRLLIAFTIELDNEFSTGCQRPWNERYGRPSVELLRSSVRNVLEQTDRLATGLEPYPEGWRASGRYVAQTRAMLADPLTGLPRHPMVLHRGGWPDGS